ncbi:SPOR domain-containing protein [Paenibacillus borealis]|uniref:SPOR domain-containing protein n=1 Tax=Paenibacillus borealis TaxID=160799 RepID=UPI0006944AA0|nr:SPOR domain-containing protein [Paenibacillus borealis]
MTFRFDGETAERKAEMADRRMVREPGRTLELEDRGQREEIRTTTHLRADEYIVDLEREEPPRAAEVSYMKSSGPRRRNWDDSDGEYETGQYSIIPDSRTRTIPVYAEDYREDDNGPGEYYPLFEDERDPEPERFGQFSMNGNLYGGSYHTRRPSYWWKFALSVAGALGTGILLGYAALSFIGSGGSGTGNGNGSTAIQTGTVQSQNVTDGGTEADITGVPVEGTGEAVAVHVPVQIAAQSYYLLQYGVFSTPAGAAQAQQELLAAGLAAGLDPADGNRVYAGMSPDREQAKLLSSGLKNQGIELYVREVALPAVDQVSYNGTAEAVDSYFAISSQLLSELSGLSASLLSGAGSVTDSSAVSDLHMQWTQAVKLLESGLSPEGQGIASGLEKSMSRGISALNEYGKNKAEGLLWEVQEAMMSFLTGQKSLLTAIS